MKLTWLEFWVSALACYRVTILISRCTGPFDVFKKLRKNSKFLKCPFCVSIYIGAFTCEGLYQAGFTMPLSMWVILSLSFSAITIMADRTFTSDHNP